MHIQDWTQKIAMSNAKTPRKNWTAIPVQIHQQIYSYWKLLKYWLFLFVCFFIYQKWSSSPLTTDQTYTLSCHTLKLKGSASSRILQTRADCLNFTWITWMSWWARWRGVHVLQSWVYIHTYISTKCIHKYKSRLGTVAMNPII